jgi:tetratricopeptide (TPR) repeat protein
MQREVSILLIALSTAGAALAADDPVRQAARQHYGRGLELAGQGQYEQALSEFLAAYRDRPHYATLYNIGQAHIELGRAVEAIATLERYLAEGKDQIPLERAEQVRAQIAAQKALTAELIVVVEAPGASIAVDGLAVGSSPRVGPLRLAVGAYEVVLSTAGTTGMHRPILLVAGQTLELAFADAAPPTAGNVAPHTNATDAAWMRQVASPLPDAADAGASRVAATLGYVLGGVGVALGGVAIGQYFWNRERYDRWRAENQALELDPARGQAHRERQIESNELAASIERASHWTVALGVAGGAFLASGATLLVVHASAPAPATRESATLFLLEGAW